MIANRGDKRDYLAETRLWYPEGYAPFGELDLIRPDYNFSRNAQNSSWQFDASLARLGPEVVRKAWANSAWASEISTEEDLHSFSNERHDALSKIVTADIITAAYHPLRKSAWFAIQARAYQLSIEGETAKPKSTQKLPMEYVVGFSNAKQDISGTAFQKANKRLFKRQKIYAAVSNIDVLPAMQKQGVGTALLSASLKMFRPEQKPTIYVPANSESLIQKLGELSYKETGSQPRVYPGIGVEVEEVRLEGKSVKEVEGRLLETAEWLKEAVPCIA
jgi:ribosomal protein S18 acetylase RimI-like enzyme